MFIVGFAFLTIVAATEQGVTLATVLSVFILVLLAVGIVGALRNPPDDEPLAVHDAPTRAGCAARRPRAAGAAAGLAR